MAFTKQRWVIGGIVAVGAVLLISEHGNQPIGGDTGIGIGIGTDTSTSTAATSAARPCTVTVTADVLNARSSPDGNARVVDIYRKGEVVSADRATRNGFRQLAPDRWVPQEFLEPTPGSDCG